MKRQARAESWVVHGWVANLEHVPLPRERFDLVLVTNYLQRDLWPSLMAAVTPGGFLLYETFTVAQLALPRGPRSAHHLLRIGELAGSVPGWSIEEDVEVESPLAQARLVARKPDGREQERTRSGRARATTRALGGTGSRGGERAGPAGAGTVATVGRRDRAFRGRGRDRGPGNRVRGPGNRVRGPGNRVRGPGNRVRGPGNRVRGPGNSRGTGFGGRGTGFGGRGTAGGPGNRVRGPGNRVRGPGNRVRGPGNRVRGPGNRVRGPGNRVRGPGNRVRGPELRARAQGLSLARAGRGRGVREACRSLRVAALTSPMTGRPSSSRRGNQNHR